MSTPRRSNPHKPGLFQSPNSSPVHKAAAAYGLCGVYQKLNRVQDQPRFALWLHAAAKSRMSICPIPLKQVFDQSLYWAVSGWDLNLLLEDGASLEELQAFVAGNPNLADLRVVTYALAVRLARENRYDESAQVFESIHAIVRAPRMRQLASLYKEAIGQLSRGRSRAAGSLQTGGIPGRESQPDLLQRCPLGRLPAIRLFDPRIVV